MGNYDSIIKNAGVSARKAESAKNAYEARDLRERIEWKRDHFKDELEKEKKHKSPNQSIMELNQELVDKCENLLNMNFEDPGEVELAEWLFNRGEFRSESEIEYCMKNQPEELERRGECKSFAGLIVLLVLISIPFLLAEAFPYSGVWFLALLPILYLLIIPIGLFLSGSGDKQDAKNKSRNPDKNTHGKINPLVVAGVGTHMAHSAYKELKRPVKK